MGAAAAFDSADDRWPVQADVVVESVGPATWDRSVRILKAGRPAGGVRRHVRGEVELNLPRLFFKQYEIIGSSMGSYQEFAELTRWSTSGLDVHIDRVVPLVEYPDAARPPRSRRAARQDRAPLTLTDPR